MKRFLKKRWHSIPVGIITAVLVLGLVAGGVFAAIDAFEVFRSVTKVTVLEPLEVIEIQAPGEFWDWGTGQEEPREIVLQPVYAGQDLGATGIGGKYYIKNLMPAENPRGTSIPVQYISVTVTVEETTGQMEWYGIDIYPSSGWGATDTCNWNSAFVKSTADGNVQTFTFNMGNTAYPGGGVTPSDEIGQDSNQVVFFVQGKVADSSTLAKPLNFIVTVERG